MSIKRCIAPLAACVVAIAHAQSPADLDAVLKLKGEARVNALVEGAKKEGEVMVYHSTQLEDLRPVFEAFTKKYGIKVRDWRSSSENVVQRVISETRAGKRDVDFVENNAPEQEALVREKMLRTMDSPHFADLRAGTLPAHHQWATSTLDVFVQAYNTDRVQKEELPKTYEDLANPRWKGRLGIEAEDWGWFGTIVETMGQEKGLRTFRDIVSNNGFSVRKGHTLLAQLVATGEIPFALTVYSYKPPQLKDKGAPVDWILIPPVIAQMHAVAVTAKGTHPFAAALLFDFFLGEGQQLLAKKHFTPSNTKVPSPFANVELKLIDPAENLDKQQQWIKQYDDIVIRGGTGGKS
jgi:iron(III) transport system substrate-binding protein